jgi:hypothetical protein
MRYTVDTDLHPRSVREGFEAMVLDNQPENASLKGLPVAHCTHKEMAEKIAAALNAAEPAGTDTARLEFVMGRMYRTPNPQRYVDGEQRIDWHMTPFAVPSVPIADYMRDFRTVLDKAMARPTFGGC